MASKDGISDMEHFAMVISPIENVIPVQGTGVSDRLQFRTAIITEVFKFACIVPKGGTDVITWFRNHIIY